MNSKAVVRAQKRKKQNAVDHFGGKCQLCGYSKCLDALEFHHLDKKIKEESPSYVILRWAWERAKEELEKCILVCSNCHREIHSVSGVGIMDLQRLIKPWMDKECCHCKKMFSTKQYDQKFCSPSCKQVSERRVVRPSKNELKVLMQTTSWIQLGRMFGVSDNAVRKWARKYDLLGCKHCSDAAVS